MRLATQGPPLDDEPGGWGGVVLLALLLVLVVLGAVLSCATPGGLNPLPPLPGPDVTDWSARAPDGGGQ